MQPSPPPKKPKEDPGQLRSPKNSMPYASVLATMRQQGMQGLIKAETAKNANAILGPIRNRLHNQVPLMDAQSKAPQLLY